MSRPGRPCPRRNPPTTWTREEEEALAKLRPTGMTPQTIADGSGKTKQQVESKIEYERVNVGMPKHQTETRKCLRCAVGFPSQGAHNRMCAKCKAYAASAGYSLEPS